MPTAAASRRYRYRMGWRTYADVACLDQRSDAISGTVAGDPGSDRVVAHFVTHGSMRLESPEEAVTLRPGSVCVRDIRTAWRFSFGAGTVAPLLIVPRSGLVPHLPAGTTLPTLTMAEQGAPEVRLLSGHLELMKSFADGELPQAGLRAAGNATLELLAAVLSANCPADGAPFRSSLRAAGLLAIDEYLLDPQLDPALIAHLLNVSVRTLHRAFADTGDPVMACVRQRRLDRARAELAAGGGLTVSEIAARWHFADASHFVRSFKKRHGVTPSACVPREPAGPEPRDSP
ncbi:helix-turn-helix domain-containing protein [Streptomyces sp. NPDC058280]|uniref:helix-turn-helix domain-containing protein n=1 Tax=Streptomyces sp. NPDC058280 TaxID=3346419 RepID=UPI0036E8028E